MEEDENEFFGKNFKYTKIPYGLLTELSNNQAFPADKLPEFDFTITNQSDYHHQSLMILYYNGYINRANYLVGLSKFDEAEELVKKALRIDPASAGAKQLLSKIQSLKNKGADKN